MGLDQSSPSSSQTSNFAFVPQDTTAWAQTTRAALGIRPDTIEMAFTQMNPLYSGSVFGYQNYRSTASNPMLDHYLENVYSTLTSDTGKSDSNWQALLAQLIGYLPEDVQAMINAQPPTSASTSLLNALEVGSKFLSGLDSNANIPNVSEVVASRTALNMVLPFLVLQGAINNTNETMTQISNFLATEGAKYSNYDYYSNAIENLQEPMTLLAAVKSAMTSAVNGVLPDNVRQMAEKADAELDAIVTQLQTAQPRDSELQVLLDSVKALKVTADALTLPTINAAALFTSFYTASIGLDAQSSVTGLNGPILSQIGEVSTALADAALPSSPNSVKTLLSNASMLLNDLFMSATSQAVQPPASTGPSSQNYGLFALAAMLPGTGGDLIGLLCIGMMALMFFGKYPNTEPDEIPSAHFFAFETLLNGLVGSDLLTQFYKSFIGAISKNEAGAEALAPAYSLISLTLITLSAVSYGKQSADILLQQFAPTIQRGLIAIKTLLEKRGSDDVKIAAALVAIDEALHALDSHDYSRLLTALGTFLELNGTSLENLTKEVDVIRKASNIVVKQMNETKAGDHSAGVITVA